MGSRRLRKTLLYSSAFITFVLMLTTWNTVVNMGDGWFGLALAFATIVAWLHTYFWSSVELQWVEK